MRIKKELEALTDRVIEIEYKKEVKDSRVDIQFKDGEAIDVSASNRIAVRIADGFLCLYVDKNTTLAYAIDLVRSWRYKENLKE